MAINKKLIHFKTFETFNSLKLSANEENTKYTLGVNGEVQDGAPDILYQSIVWIKIHKSNGHTVRCMIVLIMILKLHGKN
jgi:hypothetical protein